jgi:formate dehydrogenase subunit gamma
MAETTPRQSEVPRFSAGERWLHRALALLMSLLIVTAALLYVDPLSQLVGRRALLATVHFWAGVALPLPLLIVVVLSPAFRRDATVLNRFGPEDAQWLRSALRGNLDGPSGKFNAGQKLNSAFVLGAIVVMFITGLMMHFFDALPDSLRTGATFVHDVFGMAVFVMAAGHLWMAWNDPEARRGLRTGAVSREWAGRKHPLWRQPL